MQGAPLPGAERVKGSRSWTSARAKVPSRVLRSQVKPRACAPRVLHPLSSSPNPMLIEVFFSSPSGASALERRRRTLRHHARHRPELRQRCPVFRLNSGPWNCARAETHRFARSMPTLALLSVPVMITNRYRFLDPAAVSLARRQGRVLLSPMTDREKNYGFVPVYLHHFAMPSHDYEGIHLRRPRGVVRGKLCPVCKPRHC